MKFSIVVPVYNKQDYLKLTLQSVLAQKFIDYEILVIDDGSTDNSVALVKQFTDTRIKLIQQKNAGVSVARNCGISHATGDWVCFLDADDWYHPDYLTELAVMSDTYPTHKIIATRFVPMPDQPNWAPVAWVHQQRDYEQIYNLPARWLKSTPFFTSSIAIKRTTLLAMQPCFASGEASGEDLDLWFRLAENYPIVLLQQPLVVYRTQVANGLSVTSHQSVSAPYLARMVQRAQTLSTELKHATLDYVTHFYITAARAAAGNGQRGLAFKLLLKHRARGIQKRRWWVTLVMLTAMPAWLMRSLQKWRESRTHARL